MDPKAGIDGCSNEEFYQEDNEIGESSHVFMEQNDSHAVVALIVATDRPMVDFPGYCVDNGVHGGLRNVKRRQ